MRKIYLTLLVLMLFCVFDVTLSRTIPWVSNNHLNRVIMDVYIYTPYEFFIYIYPLPQGYSIIDVTIPIVIDSKSLGIADCSEILIYNVGDENPLPFYVDERPEYTCGTSTTQIFVKGEAYFIGNDEVLMYTIHKMRLVIYYNALSSFNNPYYNNFYAVFDTSIPATFFNFGISEYGEISFSSKKTNFYFYYTFIDLNITSDEAPSFTEIYFTFVLRPKIKNVVNFYAKDVDDFIRLCEVGLLPKPTTTEPCKTEILKRTDCCGDAQGGIGLDYMRVFSIYFENGLGPGSFKLYLKHQDMYTYKLLDVYDSELLNYFDIGAPFVACPSVSGACFVLPVLEYSTTIYEPEVNYDLLYSYYQYATKIELDNSNNDVYLFSSDHPLHSPALDGTLVIDINTSKLIKENKLDSRCNNILFLFENRTLVYFYFDKETCNKDHTLFFVRIPNMAPGELKYLYLYTSPTTKTSLSDVFYSFDNTFDIAIEFNSLSEVFDYFDTSLGYCGGYRYFDVIDGKLYVYGSDCGTDLSSKVRMESLYIKANILQFGSSQEELFKTGSIDYYNNFYGVSFGYNGSLSYVSMCSWDVCREMYGIYNNVYYVFAPGVKYWRSTYDYWCFVFGVDVYIYNPDTFGFFSIVHPFYGQYPSAVVNMKTEIGRLYDLVLSIDKIGARNRWFNGGYFRYSVGVAEQLAPIEYYNITLRAVDENNNPVSTNIYIDGVRRDLDVRIQIAKGEHTISADIPSGYEFQRWVSIFGNTVFENAYNVSTKITVNGDDTIILRLKTKPIKYRLCFIAFDMEDNVIPTYIYVNNVRYSVGSCVDIDKGTYSISADIPTGYSFVNWESMFGNIVFYNPNVLNTQFTLNGNDTIILRLQYTVAPPTPPPAVYYNITCYIVDENNTAIPGAKILLDNIQCSHSQRITVSSGTYTLNTLLPANYTFYMYESDLYIYYPKSKITSVIVNKDGYIKSIIKYYPYGYLPELPPESIIKDITSFGQLLLLLSILIIGAVFSMFGNLPIGVSFIVSGILFTFLPSDALGYFLLGVSAVITYFIVRAIIK